MIGVGIAPISAVTGRLANDNPLWVLGDTVVALGHVKSRCVIGGAVEVASSRLLSRIA